MTNSIDVRLLCTARGSHPSRELAWVNWGGLSVEFPGLDPASPVGAILLREADMVVFDNLRPSHRREPGRRASPVSAAKQEYRPYQGGADTRGDLHRFRCPTCRLDVPMRADRLHTLVKGLIEQGVFTFDLSRAC